MPYSGHREQKNNLVLENFKKKLTDWIQKEFIDESENYEFIDFIRESVQHEKKKRTYYLINELYEYIEFAKADCAIFARTLGIKLYYEEDQAVVICENKHFQNWVFDEIINYLK